MIQRGMKPSASGTFEGVAGEVVDGADGLDGRGLFEARGFFVAGGDGGQHLERVEHASGDFEVHGAVLQGAVDLGDGEKDGGRVLEERGLVDVGLLHVVELHVEEALWLACHGGRAAAVAVGL